jgi:hypothetical protein
MAVLRREKESSCQGGASRRAQDSSKKQAAWGAWVVIAGLVAIVAVFGFSLLRFDKAAEVATAVGSVSGIIAALIGAYFGIRGSSLAQAQVIEMMSQQQPNLERKMPPDTAATPED